MQKLAAPEACPCPTRSLMYTVVDVALVMELYKHCGGVSRHVLQRPTRVRGRRLDVALDALRSAVNSCSTEQVGGVLGCDAMRPMFACCPCPWDTTSARSPTHFTANSSMCVCLVFANRCETRSASSARGRRSATGCCISSSTTSSAWRASSSPASGSLGVRQEGGALYGTGRPGGLAYYSSPTAKLNDGNFARHSARDHFLLFQTAGGSEPSDLRDGDAQGHDLRGLDAQQAVPGADRVARVLGAVRTMK